MPSSPARRLAVAARAIAGLSLALGVPTGLALAARSIAMQGWWEQGLYRLVARELFSALWSTPLLVATTVGAVAALAVVASRQVRPGLAAAWMLLAWGLGAAPAIALASALRPPIREAVFRYTEDAEPVVFVALVLLWAAADAAEVLIGALALVLTGVVAWSRRVTLARLEGALKPLDRPRLLASSALVVAAGLIAAGVVAFRPAKGTDVVVILIDTVRAERLDLYGHDRPTAPHLAAFADDAVWYRQAVSPSPWTTPSVAAVLTGNHPVQYGYRDRPVALPPTILTLPEAFAAEGYTTAGVVSNLFASSLAGFDQGFATWDEDDAQGADHISSASVTDKALAIADAASPSRPLFLWVHYYDPHCAYADHDTIDYASDSYEGPVEPMMNSLQIDEITPRMGPADVEQIAAYYDEELRYTDEHVGRLLDGLKASGRYDDAMVVLFADHGEAFADREGGHIGHGVTLYQELLRVPLLVKWPGGKGAGTVIDDRVTLMDISRTLADLALSRPMGDDGEPLPTEPPPAGGEPRRVFAETRYKAWQLAVFDGPWKLVHDLTTDELSLYDLDADPGEKVDVSADHPARVEALAEALRAFHEGRGPALPDVELSADEEAMLEALGYLEDDD